MLLAIGTKVVMAIPMSRDAQRQAAIERWKARPFANYRLGVQLGRAGHFCFQEIEVHESRTTTLADTCHLLWVPSFSVERLFELGARLPYASECQPSAQDCSCRRAQIGRVVYDPKLGYPQTLSVRREISANWWHPDYWRHLEMAKALPSCNGLNQQFSISVVSLVPVP